MARCLDENTALELLDGKLASASRVQVERHLEECDACRELVAELSKDVDKAITSPKAESVLADRMPDTERLPAGAGPDGLPTTKKLGPYRIESVVGSGSAGTVYRAVDERNNGVVAVKLVTDQGLRSRFMREAETLARLEHDAIVRYLGHGEASGGMFLAMEWLDGEDLSQCLERGRIGWQGARMLGLRISAALAQAHALGCVHRDLSPRNVFLPGGKLERAKLLDFGLVRVPDTQLAQTASHAVLGTPFYMSPEHIRDAKSVTARSDLFALGVLLYEAISGVRPFEADDLFTLWVRIVDLQPTDLRSFGRDIPEALVVLVESLLAKDPALRPASASEVHHRLMAIPVSTTTISASMSAIPLVVPRTPPPPALPSPPPDRTKLIVAIVGGVAAVALAATGYVGFVNRSRIVAKSPADEAANTEEPSSKTDEKSVRRRFPFACDTNEEIEAEGDWSGAGPIVTSTGTNCKISIKNAKLKGSSLINTSASGVELTLDNVTIETTATAVTAGTNLTMKVRGSSIVSSAGVVDSGMNLELPQLEDSTLVSKGGSALRGSGGILVRASRSKIRAKDSAIDAGMALEVSLRKASEVESSDGTAIKANTGLKLDAEGGRIAGVRGIGASSNATIDARALVLSGTREPAIVATSNAIFSFTDGSISSGGDAAVAIDGGSVTLAAVQVRGTEAGIRAKNALHLKANKGTHIVATSGDAIVTTTNAELTIVDAVVDGAEKAITGTTNASIKLGQGARVTGRTAGVDVETNAVFEGTNGATLDGGGGPGLAALTNARISFRGGTLKGSPALRCSSKPTSLDLQGTRIEGGQKIAGR
jgi:serine/threonine protein kinase